MEDDQMQSLDGQPHSGSVSTLEPGDWPTNEAAADIQGSSHLLPQQLVHLAQHAAQQQQQPGAHEFTMAQQIAAQQLRGRRNARQQEQNKQAQQRYRAKRKAQFEDLQRRVAHLTAEAAGAQRHRQENERLRAEMERMKVLLQAATAGGAAAPAAAAAAAAVPGGPLSGPGSSSSLPDLMGPPPLNGFAAGSSPAAPKHPSSLLPGAGGGGGGAFKPTASTRALAPATLAELPVAGLQPPPAAAAQAAAPPAAPAAQPSARQVQAALELYYAELQAFSASVQLDRIPADGSALGAEAAGKLTELVRTGIELIRMVLQASGPDAAALLTANLPAVGADGTSPADSLAQWRMVAARLGLTAEQRALLSDWRRRFLQRLDDCYGRRLLHKAQLAQLPANGGTQPQCVEALLLQAAESAGFSACALACAQLDGVVGVLGDNVQEERAAACTLMSELLDHILTKVQAARFLLAGHPFCWNGLSFAHAARPAASSDPVVTRERSDGGFELSISTPHAGLLRSVHFTRSTPVQFAAIIPGDGVAEVVLTSGLNNFLQLYNAALICRLIITWFPNPPQAIVTPLATVVDPYLNLFRGIIPPLGGIDLSPILAFVVLDLFTNSAAALPAEIDEHGQLKAPASGLGAWQRRMQASAERRRAEREQRAAAQQQ
ncbi:YGGT family [Micractinium conductrix]|uniref:YGGT family n=1 Tax=Micractinium conductrix TaxID=554055 RepID=A0A2P6VHM7_9CHLO|nr:YGGT family [Micractinium conductrix]|eukprot:PSC73578.1 YGGT family [Micractinium conductrix]